MPLQKYVHQVKIREDKRETDKVELIKNLVLSEAKSTASTLFEGVIADCANLSGKSKKTFKKEILDQPYISEFLPLADSMTGSAGKTAFATKGKTEWIEGIPLLHMCTLQILGNRHEFQKINENECNTWTGMEILEIDWNDKSE